MDESSIINHHQSSSSIINHQSSIINHQSSSSIINHHHQSSIIIINLSACKIGSAPDTCCSDKILHGSGSKGFRGRECRMASRDVKRMDEFMAYRNVVIFFGQLMGNTIGISSEYIQIYIYIFDCIWKSSMLKRYSLINQPYKRTL